MIVWPLSRKKMENRVEKRSFKKFGVKNMMKGKRKKGKKEKKGGERGEKRENIK